MTFVCLTIIGFVTITQIALYLDCISSNEGDNE